MGVGMGVGSELAKGFMNKQNTNNPAQNTGIECTGCRTVHPMGTSFCGNCGTKLVLPPPPPPAVINGIACACGVVNDEKRKFCSDCGSPLEAKPAPSGITCVCGVLNDNNRKFCSDCGNKL